MRKNISKVIKAFKAGKAAKGDSKKTCWTDGNAIYSYNIKLLRRTLEGLEIISYDNSPSVTTSRQLNSLRVSFPDAKIVNEFS